jgi:hypothetical protein
MVLLAQLQSVRLFFKSAKCTVIWTPMSLTRIQDVSYSILYICFYDLTSSHQFFTSRQYVIQLVKRQPQSNKFWRHQIFCHTGSASYPCLQSGTRSNFVFCQYKRVCHHVSINPLSGLTMPIIYLQDVIRLIVYPYLTWCIPSLPPDTREQHGMESTFWICNRILILPFLIVLQTVCHSTLCIRLDDLISLPPFYVFRMYIISTL